MSFLKLTRPPTITAFLIPQEFHSTTHSFFGELLSPIELLGFVFVGIAH